MMANDCHPFKTVLPICFQACFFTSMFFGLRGMCNTPVESMKSGGLLWFPELTVADPFLALPLLTATTLSLQIYFNADGMNTANTPEWLRKVINEYKLLLIGYIYIQIFSGHVYSPTDLHSCHDSVPCCFEFVLANQQPRVSRSS